MDAPTTPPRSVRGAALVGGAIVADFMWIHVHVGAISALGFLEGDPGFYVAYQAVRAAIAGGALAVALRAGLFDREELGLDSRRHRPALRWLARVLGYSLAVVLGASLILSTVARQPLCSGLEGAFGGPLDYPWPVFVRDTLCMVLVAPLYEEILYRSLLLAALGRYLSQPLHALVLAGGVFVALHYFYGYGLNSMYLLVALVLGGTLLRTRSIVPAILLHAVNNLWFTVSSYARSELGEGALFAWLCAR